MKRLLSFILLFALLLTSAGALLMPLAAAEAPSENTSGISASHFRPKPTPTPPKTPPPPKPTWIIPTMKPNPTVKPGHQHIWEKCYTYRIVRVPYCYWDGRKWVVYYQQQTQRVLVVRCRICGYILSVTPY